MGDYTQAFIEVDGGSENLRLAINNVWREYTGRDLDEDDYTEVSTCTVQEIQPLVAKILDGTPREEWPTFICLTEDACYEYPGDLYRWRPALGWHTCSIDNGGSPIIEKDWLLDAIAAAPSLDALRENIRSHVGEAWAPQWRVGKLTPGSLPGTTATYPLRRFFTHDEAAEYISTLPDHETGIYTLDGPSEDTP